MLLVCVLINNSFTVQLCFVFTSSPLKCCWFVWTWTTYSVGHCFISSLSECCWFMCLWTIVSFLTLFFFFYLIPISVLPGCAVCITVLDLILLVPHQYAAGLCAIVAVSVFYIFCFMGKILLDIFVLLFFYLFSIKMLLCCCCCFNYLLLSFLLEAYLNK